MAGERGPIRRRRTFVGVLADCRIAFVQGEDDPEHEGETRYPTLEELAERHKIELGRLRRQAETEDWEGSRDLLAARLVARAVGQRIGQQARKAQEVDDRVIRQGEIGLQLTQRLFAEMSKRVQIAIRDESLQHQEGSPIPFSPSFINPKDVHTLAQTVDLLHKTLRAATGDPVPELAHARRAFMDAAPMDAQSVTQRVTAPEELVRDVVRFWAELERSHADRAPDPAVIHGELETPGAPQSAPNGHVEGFHPDAR